MRKRSRVSVSYDAPMPPIDSIAELKGAVEAAARALRDGEPTEPAPSPSEYLADVDPDVTNPFPWTPDDATRPSGDRQS